MMVNNASLAGAAQSTRRIDLSAALQVSAPSERRIDPLTMDLLNRIGGSERLTASEKSSLVTLVAFVDEFGGEDRLKIFSQIYGLVAVMESTGDEEGEALQPGALADEYWEARDALSPPEVEASLQVRIDIEATYEHHRGVTLASQDLDMEGLAAQAPPKHALQQHTPVPMPTTGLNIQA